MYSTASCENQCKRLLPFFPLVHGSTKPGVSLLFHLVSLIPHLCALEYLTLEANSRWPPPQWEVEPLGVRPPLPDPSWPPPPPVTLLSVLPLLTALMAGPTAGLQGPRQQQATFSTSNNQRIVSAASLEMVCSQTWCPAPGGGTLHHSRAMQVFIAGALTANPMCV